MFMKNKVTLINTISNVLLQFFSILNGFIIPKIILINFGSNINGLVSSINQFLGYISLLEGGVTSVITIRLYKALSKNNNKEVSSIIKTADSIYKKISIFFLLYSLVIALINPLIFKTDNSFAFVFFLILILAINLFMQYAFSLTWKTLLCADKKIYIVSITQIIIIIVNIIFGIFSVTVYKSIHLFKFLTSLMFFIQPIIFGIYIKRNYNLNKDVPFDKKLQNDRWDAFMINIASILRFGTDTTILTFFTNFSIVSVYSVYFLVITGLRSVVFSISNAINPSISQLLLSDDKSKFEKNFSVYEYINFSVIYFLFSISFLLITPFVLIYTKNITDASYNQPILGMFLILSEVFNLVKLPFLNMAYADNRFKEISKCSFMEAFVNIVLSIILVLIYGLNGVAFATIVSTIFSLIYIIKLASKKILLRNQNLFYKKFFVFAFMGIIGIIISKYLFPLESLEILNWCKSGFIYLFIFGILWLLCSFIYFRKEIKILKEYICK